MAGEVSPPQPQPQSARRKPCFRDALIRRAFDRVAPRFADNDFLYREMARRMAERLEMVRLSPVRILDLGCGLGADRLMLQQCYPEATWVGVDASTALLHEGRLSEQAARSFMQRLLPSRRSSKNPRLAGRAVALPLTTQCVDLVWSNAMLHWLDDLPAALAEANRVLAIGGLFMFSLFGPDTLKELRQAIHAVSPALADSMIAYTDMHDVGDMLVHAGFADPVMDMEILTLTYEDPWRALRELQGAGSVAAQVVEKPFRGLRSRHFWRRVFEHWPRDAEGRYRLTFELIQGHAWKVAPRQHEDGRAVIQFMTRPGQGLSQR